VVCITLQLHSSQPAALFRWIIEEIRQQRAIEAEVPTEPKKVKQFPFSSGISKVGLALECEIPQELIVRNYVHW